MLIEGNFLPPDELHIGIHLFYGEDDNGKFHCTSLGFIFFEIEIYIYIK